MYNKILVPLDGSALAEAILPHVCALAQCTSARILLLRVTYEPIYTYSMTEPGHGGATTSGQLQNESSLYLNAVAEQLRQEGLQAEILCYYGEPAETIARVARELEVDLIAMCTHGRQGLERLVFGSVAQAVLHLTTIPVMLIKAPRRT